MPVLDPLALEPHADAVVPDDLDQIAADTPEHIEIAGMRVAAESLLYLQRQTVHAFPHVGPAHRQPHPHAAWNRDHRRASALMTAEARSTGIEPGMRTRILPANSTSIADSLQLASSVAWPGLSDEAIRTCAKPDAAARSSCRQR